MLTETIVENLSLTAHGRNLAGCAALVDVADTFPWRISDQWVPDNNSGFVYLLISTPQPKQLYVGTTKNLAVRIDQHNRGYGSEGTACPDYLPWAIAAYISGMSHLSESERKGIEREWQELNRHSCERHQRNLEQMIENGRTVVNDHNSYCEHHPDRKLNYIVLAQRRFALETEEIDAGT